MATNEEIVAFIKGQQISCRGLPIPLTDIGEKFLPEDRPLSEICDLAIQLNELVKTGTLRRKYWVIKDTVLAGEYDSPEDIPDVLCSGAQYGLDIVVMYSVVEAQHG